MVEYLAADAGEVADWALSAVLSLRYEADTRTDLEALWLQNLTDGSGVVAPKVSYTFADGVTGEVGAAVLYGTDDSQFGVLRDSSSFTFSLAYAF